MACHTTTNKKYIPWCVLLTSKDPETCDHLWGHYVDICQNAATAFCPFQEEFGKRQSTCWSRPEQPLTVGILTRNQTTWQPTSTLRKCHLTKGSCARILIILVLWHGLLGGDSPCGTHGPNKPNTLKDMSIEHAFASYPWLNSSGSRSSS